MICKGCGSERIASVIGKVSDCCTIEIDGKEKTDYVPRDMGIGGGDYLRFSYCLGCGQMIGQFPVGPTDIENDE